MASKTQEDVMKEFRRKSLQVEKEERLEKISTNYQAEAMKRVNNLGGQKTNDEDHESVDAQWTYSPRR